MTAGFLSKSGMVYLLWVVGQGGGDVGVMELGIDPIENVLERMYV